MQLLTAHQTPAADSPDTVSLPNDTDVASADLQGVRTVLLQFPRFSDGRAFSQAMELRRRRGFDGDIVATGDVLIDQVLQMKRCGFSHAVLRADQNLPHAEKLLRHFPAFYQGDAASPQPLFARA